jgi:hypothetical protein
VGLHGARLFFLLAKFISAANRPLFFGLTTSSQVPAASCTGIYVDHPTPLSADCAGGWATIVAPSEARRSKKKGETVTKNEVVTTITVTNTNSIGTSYESINLSAPT